MTKMTKILLLILLILCCSFVSAVSIDRLYNLYDPEHEMGICGKTSVWLEDDQLEFKLKGHSLYGYGTKDFVKTRCKSAYNTLVHSHGHDALCEWSEIDLDTFDTKSWIRTSILICHDGYRVMAKTRGSVYERYYNYTR